VFSIFHKVVEIELLLQGVPIGIDSGREKELLVYKLNPFPKVTLPNATKKDGGPLQ